LARIGPIGKNGFASANIDDIFVMALGTPEEITQAKDILRSTNPTRLDVHPCVETAQPRAGGRL
jgi:coproporphyrinogen III oxidase-like Fe-S oxidoreductase